MSLFYYSDFKDLFKSSNFGDDINPFLLGELFDEKILRSPSLSLVGVGTLLNNKNVQALSEFKKVIVFSSGVGYGELTSDFDDRWDFVCVRGPLSASKVGLAANKAICDGAILLSDYFNVVPEGNREISSVFVPHIKTHWSSGQVLKEVSERIGMTYLSPDLPRQDFIDQVSNAKVVVTEAMHGAILADTMRVPWVPVSLHEHNQFKWNDWFLSMGMDYRVAQLTPPIWNTPSDALRKLIKYPLQKVKKQLMFQRLREVLATEPSLLSNDSLLKEKKLQLREKVEYINSTYGGSALR